MIQPKIDKGIPLSSNPTAPKYYWHRMKLGDSIFFEDRSLNPASAANNYGARTGKKFAARIEGTGRRIWRTK